MTIAYSGDSITYPDLSVQATAPKVGMVNRVINGGMTIDQRNAGASVTLGSATTYLTDRWNIYPSQASKLSAQQNAGSVTPPTGFTNYLGITSLSAYSVTASDEFLLRQPIEGYNVSDLGFGTAGASTVTLSFRVYSSLTGAFGASLQNVGATRSYAFSYSIPVANTWTTISVTIAGDTAGTWPKTNGNGLYVVWGLGVGSTFSGAAGAWVGSCVNVPTGSVSVVGTSGATFYITGVQLEKGSTATSFDYRPYGTELQLAQRYYFKILPASGSQAFGVGFNDSTTAARAVAQFPVVMRTSPTALEQTGTAADYQIRFTGGAATTCSSVPSFSDSNPYTATFIFTVASGLTGGQASLSRAVNSTAFLAWSAEL